MKPEAQQIAIAKACGIHVCSGCNHQIDPLVCHCGSLIKNHGFQDGHSAIPIGCTCGYADAETMRSQEPDCPKYPQDLNAMHEAETVIFEHAYSSEYASQLRALLHPEPYLKNDYAHWIGAHATAAQKAEAFLRTLNLWQP